MIIRFPKQFIFGVADADLQVISEDQTMKHEQSEETMWYYFAKTSGKVYKNQTPGPGIDRYHFWKQDIEIMKKLGIRHYRTSVSMARLLKRNGEVNSKAVDWYKCYFSALTKAHIKLYITIYHWELPQFLSEQGGLTKRSIVDWLLKHAEAVYQNFGEYIEEYFILNEPWVSSMLGYDQGVFAPGEKNRYNALLSAHHLLLAQGLIHSKLISLNKSLKISSVYNVKPAYAHSLDAKDLLAASYLNGYYNTWFLDPIYKGAYPNLMIDFFGDTMPKFSAEDMKIIRIGDKLHALGINYYHGETVRYDSTGFLRQKQVRTTKAPKTSLGWPIYTPPFYPEGLYDILQQLYYDYQNYGLKNIYITENGMALKTPPNALKTSIDDSLRIEYLYKHLQQVQKALQRGIPITGYFAWTFMDNYEWIEGYRPESAFGIIHVDRKTMQRIPKKSAYWYKNLIQKHALINL